MRFSGAMVCYRAGRSGILALGIETVTVGPALLLAVCDAPMEEAVHIVLCAGRLPLQSSPETPSLDHDCHPIVHAMTSVLDIQGLQKPPVTVEGRNCLGAVPVVALRPVKVRLDSAHCQIPDELHFYSLEFGRAEAGLSINFLGECCRPAVDRKEILERKTGEDQLSAGEMGRRGEGKGGYMMVLIEWAAITIIFGGLSARNSALQLGDWANGRMNDWDSVGANPRCTSGREQPERLPLSAVMPSKIDSAVIFVSLNFRQADETGVLMTSDNNPGKTISTASNLYQNSKRAFHGSLSCEAVWC
ncbi:hypothetical protein PAAG_03426 [Paracoccidioides lutzii Pb01]|uniref:Uncharacterized protein n=1 Tax=Paracoccidioides lutzii (strain ATCC MYA-826 / Pb01) TaxID=502779 RepID=C1GX52_PARBA|nr:hypothetical protein PAAG_03426 [Paracoccidioides lutzii Pb01]EEH41140.2 hypothetical protein PAAG_03426 [Paracoccidioides lutzii Pb01]